jgi:hypothetical protein
MMLSACTLTASCLLLLPPYARRVTNDAVCVYARASRMLSPVSYAPSLCAVPAVIPLTCGVAPAIILAERSCITINLTFPASNAQIRRSVYTTYESSMPRVPSGRARNREHESHNRPCSASLTRAGSYKKRYRSRSPPTTGNSFHRRQTDGLKDVVVV